MIFHKNKKKDEPARLDISSKPEKLNISKHQITQTGNISQRPVLNPIYKNYDIASFTNNGMRVG